MKSNGRKSTIQIAYAAVTAAVYAALTVALQPVSYGVVQMRAAEALNVLPYFFSAAVPGLSVGCFIANIIGAGGIIDAVVGTAATLLSSLIAKTIRIKWLVPLPAVIINALLVGTELFLVTESGYSLWFCMGAVGLGQLVACYGLGLPLMLLLDKFGNKIFLNMR